MYFGWNLGLVEGGTLGMAIATAVVAVMYITFTLGYTELACAIPKAGGVFDYADRALGRRLGFLGGVAQIIEFVFAPPAIAYAIGAYVHLFLPDVSVINIAMCAYLLFTAINILGVQMAATFELVITVIAVVELLVFAAAAFPHVEWVNLTHNALPNGFMGVFAATPFAIWFFLGIEGLANVAEEAIEPQRNMIRGFGAAMATLLLLCLLTFVSAVGVGGWESAVFDLSGNKSDSPLPLVMSHAVGMEHWLYKVVGAVGLFGLVASFHGIILAAGRATFEFGRVGYIPIFLGKVHRRFRTPSNALLINMIIGMIALLTNRTGDIIILSCFGALTVYIIAMCSLFALRRKEPDLVRPFRTPLYPFFPLIALTIAVISLVSLTYYNFKLAGIYTLMVGAGYAYYVLGSVEDKVRN